jgi:sortase B
MKRVIYILLIVLLLGVFLAAGLHVLDILMEYRAGEKTYQEMDQFISLPEPTQAKKQDTIMSDKENVQEAEPQEDEEILWPIVDFDSLRQINGDVIGWIYIPDTQINYPIVQGENNDEYLYHLLTGEYNGSGSIFMDYRNDADWLDRHSVIYGHNMKNGTMFADILNYQNRDFYKAHPTGYLLTPYGNFEIVFFAGYVANPTVPEENAWELNFADDESYLQWLSNAESRSAFQSNTVPDVQERVITLSTCSYAYDDARFILQGVLKPMNEQ